MASSYVKAADRGTTRQGRSNHAGHQSEPLRRGGLVSCPGAGAGGAITSRDLWFSVFSFSGTLPSHFFLPLVLVVGASPCSVLILPPKGFVVLVAVVRESIST